MLFLREVQPVSNVAVTRQRQVWSMLLGVILGLLAGMVGIGGCVFLSPILLFLRWADVKQTAAGSSAFIVRNSLSGLAGSYAGSRHLRPLHLQGLLGFVLLIAGGRLLLPPSPQ